MKLVTSEEMAKIDRQAIEELGIPGIVLMENAGLQVVQAMEQHFGSLAGKNICIVCGKGNNGGDGFVVARHLANRGANTDIFLLADKKDLKKDAKINLEIALSMGLDVQELTREKAIPNLERAINKKDILIDAIFGTGLKAAPRDFYQEIIHCINSSKKSVVSVDVPTGLCASTGRILGQSCIHAQLTVTFALPKIGLFCSPYRHYMGELKVVDIGIPSFLSEEDPNLKVELLEKNHLITYFKPRPPASNKGNYGHVLIVAGSPGKTGAGVMAAQAALRCGSGLVTLGIPRSLHHILETKTTEIMTLGLSETKEQTLAPRAIKQILPIAEKMKAIAVGPGLSTHPETALLVKELITNIACPIVLDADGINNLPLASLQYSKALLIITPHPGEMARLLKISTKEVQENRLEAVQKTAIACQTYVVLKGDRTLVSDPEGNVFVNPTGNPGMATAGTGDVLTGVIAGFLAQGFSPIAACKAGVFLHGMAGDLACKQKGEMGLIATDVLDHIPTATMNLLGENIER